MKKDFFCFLHARADSARMYWKHVSAIKRRPNVPVVSLEKPPRHSTDVKAFAFAFTATINEFHKSQSPLFCTLIAENDA
jgi:hypothetical protein